MIIKLTSNYNQLIEADIIGQLTLNLIKIEDINHPNRDDVELTFDVENKQQALIILDIYFS